MGGKDLTVLLCFTITLTSSVTITVRCLQETKTGYLPCFCCYLHFRGQREADCKCLNGGLSISCLRKCKQLLSIQPEAHFFVPHEMQIGGQLSMSSLEPICLPPHLCGLGLLVTAEETVPGDLCGLQDSHSSLCSSLGCSLV